MAKKKGSQKQFLRVVAKRPCGKCNLCCKIMSVEKLEKPRQCNCDHQTDKGCAIYRSPKKPEECTKYFCAWRTFQNLFGYEWKPNKCGIIVWTEHTSLGNVFCVDLDSTFPDVQDNLRKLIRFVLEPEGWPILVFGLGGKRTLIQGGVVTEIESDKRSPDARLGESYNTNRVAALMET